MTDRIENQETADRIAVDAVERQGGGQHLGQGTGVGVDHEAEIVAAENVTYSPDHAAELERDRAASAGLIESCKATGALPYWPTERHPRGYQSEINQGTGEPYPADGPPGALPAWTPPTGGGK